MMRPVHPGRLARGAVNLVRASDVAIGYAVIVTVVAITLATLPSHVHHDVIEHSSTNLANLRDHPLWVLFVSAFVVSSLAGLWQLPLILLAYAAAQRWVGRLATIFVAVLGHVGATLAVATLLASGIAHGRLARSVAHASDVGVSYGLACVAGFLVCQVRPRWRLPYVALLVAYFVGPIVTGPTFTDIGHSIALALGLGLALLAARVAAAPTRS